MYAYGWLVKLLVVFAFVLALLVAAGIGANDSVNSFGSLYGAKSLNKCTIRVLSVIFESLGSLLLGMGTAQRIRNEIIDFEDVKRVYSRSLTCFAQFSNETDSFATLSNSTTGRSLTCAESIHLLGNLSVLMTCTISLFIANLLKIPASGTHVMVGSFTGYALIALKGKYIKWSVLLIIASMWILSPVISGTFSIVVFYVLNRLIGRNQNKTITAWVVTLLYFFTIFLFFFSIFFQNYDFLYSHLHTPYYVMVPLIILFSVLISIIIRYIFFPRLYKKMLNENIKSSVCEEPSNPPVVDDYVLPASNTTTNVDPIEVINSEVPDCNNAIKALLKNLQIFTACCKSFAHGGNDVCNSVAPLITIWLIYDSAKLIFKVEPTVFIIGFGALGMSIGIIIWGTRVMETVGNRITEITPIGGFSIDFASSTTVLISTLAKIPISTTHCTVGSTVAIGWWRKGFKSVDLKLLSSILVCWVVSIPIPALLSVAIFLAFRTAVFGFPS